MHFLPYDVNTTEPSKGGSAKYPEGLYLLQMENATKDTTEKNGQLQRRDYETRIVMGPGWSQEYAGKKYTFGYRTNDPENQKGWNERHMAVAVACLGSIEAVRQMAQQYNGYLPGEALHGRHFIVELGVNGNFNNVIRCLPYTEQVWNEEVGTAQPSQPVAPAPVAPTAPPVSTPAPAPVAAPPAFAPPQGFAPPAAPPAPAAAPPAPAAPPAAAPQGFAPPAPPPPPGIPAR